MKSQWWAIRNHSGLMSEPSDYDGEIIPHLIIILLARELHASTRRVRTSTIFPFPSPNDDTIGSEETTIFPLGSVGASADGGPIFIEGSSCDSTFDGWCEEGAGSFDDVFLSLDLVATSKGASSKKGIPSICWEYVRFTQEYKWTLVIGQLQACLPIWIMWCYRMHAPEFVLLPALPP